MTSWQGDKVLLIILSPVLWYDLPLASPLAPVALGQQLLDGRRKGIDLFV